MLDIQIPGCGPLALSNLVLDMNGTIAVDGAVPDAVAVQVCELAENLQVFLLTADTFGTAADLAGRLGAELFILEPGGREAEQKADFVRTLGPATCVVIGNGANDVLMMGEAGVAIGVLGREGMAAPVATAADVIVTDPMDALDLLLSPKRLVATLRR